MTPPAVQEASVAFWISAHPLRSLKSIRSGAAQRSCRLMPCTRMRPVIWMPAYECHSDGEKTHESRNIPVILTASLILFCEGTLSTERIGRMMMNFLIDVASDDSISEATSN